MMSETKEPLTPEELARYSRHLILPEVGVAGQRRLKAARVLLVGAGGLGSPLAMYLAAAGVGTLGIVDFDAVEASNLQRQLLHGAGDVGRLKTESARERIGEINPHVRVETHSERFTARNALELVREYNIVADGTDNFPTRYLVGDACALVGKPNVYGSVFRFEGQASVFWPPAGPCYRCLYPEPPPPGMVPSCAEGGVLGVLPGIIGTIQAAETIKLILSPSGGGGEPLVGRLLLVNAWEMRFREVALHRDPACALCGEHPTIRELREYEAPCAAPQKQQEGAMEEITAGELKARLDAGRAVQIIDVREPHEAAIARLPGATLIPLGEIVKRAGELDAGREAVIHCKGGVRSAKAIAALQAAGYAGRLINLKGGITAWSNEVDPTVPKY